MVCQDVMILPEMLEAGMQALEESSGHTPADTCIAVFLAMEAIRQIAIMRQAGESVH